MQVVDSNGNIFGGPSIEIVGPDGKPKTIGGGGGGVPTGPAGGDLTGTYPNPGVNWASGSPAYDLLYYPLILNPAGYLTSAALTPYLTSASAALTYYPLTNPSGYITGITSLDVTSALGFTPYNSSNPAGYISGISSLDVTTALGFTPYSAANPSGYISGISSLDVTTALGFTPYNNTNPAGYITSAALAGYLTSALAATTYFPIPTGTISQYLRGDGTTATFPTIPSVTPSALTKVDDTNVTLSLGGTPSTSLLQAVTLTLGWTGTLADSRITSASTWNAKEPGITAGTTAQYWRGDKTWQTFPTIPTVTPAALTKVDDTNVTLTLGGTPASALLQAVSLTLGWSGTLADARIASAATWNAKQNALGFTPVPDSRTLTINGTTYDLTADRTWTISTASNLEIKDEGTTLTAAATSINFTGVGVTASAVGTAVTVSVNGGGAASNLFNYYNFI